MADRALAILAGAGVGAGLMYLFDPQGGRRRRALVRDQAVGVWNDARDGAEALAEDVRNRAAGLVAEARSGLAGRAADDRVLCDRVRARLGRAVSHPRAIEVTAAGGRVTVRGPVLADEADRLIATVRGVTGVAGVEDRLDRHAEPGNHPALQGGRTRPGERWELFQESWSPTARLLVGLAGCGLVGYGLTRSAPWACVAGSIGLGLVAAGLTNQGVTDFAARAAGWLPDAARP